MADCDFGNALSRTSHVFAHVGQQLVPLSTARGDLCRFLLLLDAHEGSVRIGMPMTASPWNGSLGFCGLHIRLETTASWYIISIACSGESHLHGLHWVSFATGLLRSLD